MEVFGITGGAVTNPLLVDAVRRIVVSYDSANRVLRAWRFEAGGGPRSLWRKNEFGAAGHMIGLPESGEIVTNDFGRGGEHVVVLDIETGVEKGRARIGGITQGGGVRIAGVGAGCLLMRHEPVRVDQRGG